MSTESAPSHDFLETLATDLWGCWQKLPNKGLFFVLLAAWMTLFHWVGNSTLGYVHSPSLFVWVLDNCNPELPAWLAGLDLQTVLHWFGQADEAYILVMPVVVLWLYWWKRKELMAQTLGLWTPGLWLLAGALLLHLLAFMVQQPKVSLISFLAGLYALTGLAWGPAWMRRSAFPFCLLFFCVPLGTWMLPVTFNLRLLVCWMVDGFCNNLLMIEVHRQGTMLLNPTHHYQYEVAAACSGIRSLMATLGLATVFAFVSFRTWWKRAVMVASAFPLAVLGNFLRMLAIIIASELGGQEWGNWVHEGGPLGLVSLLPYVPAFLGLIFLGSWLREPQPQPAPPAAAVTA